MRWPEVEPVLRATYQLLEQADTVRPDDVCAALGRPAEDAGTLRALALLYRDSYIAGWTVEERDYPVRIESAPRGLEYASEWPSEGSSSADVDLLLRLLEERIDDPEVPEPERTKLARVRDSVREAGPKFVTEVLAAYMAKVIPPGGE